MTERARPHLRMEPCRPVGFHSRSVRSRSSATNPRAELSVTAESSSIPPDFAARLVQERFLLVAFVGAACRGRLVGRDRVDDFVQETMGIAWARREEYDPSRPLGPWLRGIAANVVFGALRMELRRRRILDDAQHEIERMRTLGRQFDRMATRMEVDDMAASVRTCVEALPENQRDVVERHYFLGQSLVSIAVALGLTEEAVFKRVSRARGLVAKCLGRKGLLTGRIGERVEEAS
jgi:RNA polymerase sigma factor (sigma-70 family)